MGRFGKHELVQKKARQTRKQDNQTDRQMNIRHDTILNI